MAIDERSQRSASSIGHRLSISIDIDWYRFSLIIDFIDWIPRNLHHLHHCYLVCSMYLFQLYTIVSTNPITSTLSTDSTISTSSIISISSLTNWQQLYILTKAIAWGKQGWHSGESARLPPMWPGFDSRFGVICGLSLLLVLVLAPRCFSPGTRVFPSPRKPTLPNSN